MRADDKECIEAFAHRHRQVLRYSLRHKRASFVPGGSDGAAQHRVGRCENTLVTKPDARAHQQRSGAFEPQRLVLEESRQVFASGVVESTHIQVLANALLMLGDRLLPTGVRVDRLRVSSQLQGGKPQDLLVDLQWRTRFTYRPDHEWYWLPAQTPTEVSILKCYDFCHRCFRLALVFSHCPASTEPRPTTLPAAGTSWSEPMSSSEKTRSCSKEGQPSVFSCLDLYDHITR